MKNKRNILGGSLIVILVTFILVALIFALQTQAQEISSSDDNTPTGASIKTELTNGSWIMTDVKTNVYNRGNITKWENSSNEIEGLCSWKDILDIVHTVSSGFKWDAPPQTMRPGNFLNIDAKYINN